MADPQIALARTFPVMPDIARPGLLVRSEHGLAMAKLRISGDDYDLRFQAVTGVTAPAACRQVERDDLTFAWLGPGEWMVSGVDAAVASWLARIAALDAHDLLAVDISHARASFLIEGSDARTAIAAHCPLDLWQGAFPVDAVARSLLGDAGMFIARLADTDGTARFRIVVDQTMAPYAARLLSRA